MIVNFWVKIQERISKKNGFRSCLSVINYMKNEINYPSNQKRQRRNKKGEMPKYILQKKQPHIQKLQVPQNDRVIGQRKQSIM
ncbi:unnamed protein product [Paramecium sonneborni]|uniref:Uncharacterized protein n=1 Tax=Paramecium sonneborni TaxID=65129 RepID=A0A8S1PE72_9CILI|nr:unnamed protein product [Paramecium sonneborni]